MTEKLTVTELRSNLAEAQRAAVRATAEIRRWSEVLAAARHLEDVCAARLARLSGTEGADQAAGVGRDGVEDSVPAETRSAGCVPVRVAHGMAFGIYAHGFGAALPGCTWPAGDCVGHRVGPGGALVDI